MRLTFKDKQEIENIIKGFGEKENEQVYAMVEQIVDPIKSNPAENAMTVFLARHYEMDAIGLGQDDMDAQEMAHKFLWDYVTKIEQHRYALDIFKSKHSYSEVA